MSTAIEHVDWRAGGRGGAPAAAPGSPAARTRRRTAAPAVRALRAVAPLPAPAPVAVPPPGAAPDLSSVSEEEWGTDPASLCSNLALCVIEILAGARPIDQVSRWVTDAVFLQLLRRTVIAARSRALRTAEARRPRVRLGAPIITHPCDGVVEAVVIAHQPGRSRAVAIRLERYRARWRATAVTVL
ncbi:Rv3235 family protein [Leifsonia sp. AG29]|uniref:Rv3235 family protein n=1 Tax=Leifsonia sp. AG29 TaxID=2598860 RepID=UPI00131AF38E|nr:Rv3235 family protein [Leifsonia sp. AG29]